MLRSLKFYLSEAAGHGGFFFWRGVERCLGVTGLFLVARLFFGCRATLNELTKRPERVPREPAWRRIDGSFPARIRRRVQRYMILLVKHFPDRLAGPHWRDRCWLEGAEHLQAARAAGRPVVLAFFHFGPIQILRQWLRAHGFPVALYIGGDLASRKPVSRLQDRHELLREVPSLFFPGEMRPVIHFLRAGNLLLMAVDRPDGHRSAVEAEDDWITHLNTGAARLANLTGADLMLASIVIEPGNRFRIRITPLAAGEQLPTEQEWAEVNRRLLAAQLPDFKAYPEQFFWHREPAPKKL